MGNLPGWVDADQPEPDPADFGTQEVNQFAVLSNVTVFLSIVERAEGEAGAGGNPSSNVGVDYDAMLRRSADRGEVKSLYQQAGLSLHDDLRTLGRHPASRPTSPPSGTSRRRRRCVASHRGRSPGAG
jgi:hypothetical protein